MIECDNRQKCHDPFVIYDDPEEVMRVICKECKQQKIIRYEPVKRVPVNREYIKFFKRLTLQPNSNLFYKYYPQYIHR